MFPKQKQTVGEREAKRNYWKIGTLNCHLTCQITLCLTTKIEKTFFDRALCERERGRKKKMKPEKWFCKKWERKANLGMTQFLTLSNDRSGAIFLYEICVKWEGFTGETKNGNTQKLHFQLPQIRSWTSVSSVFFPSLFHLCSKQNPSGTNFVADNVLRKKERGREWGLKSWVNGVKHGTPSS